MLLNTEHFAEPASPPSFREDRRGLNVLLFNGLSDTAQVTEKLLNALSKLSASIKLKVKLVTTSALANTLHGRNFDPSLKFEVMHSLRPSEFIDLCRSVDFVIGSPGVSSVERTKQGIPQLLFALADNQIDLGKKLDRIGVASFGGDARKLGLNQVVKLIEQYINHKLIDFDAALGPLLFDFGGAARVLELMAPSDITATALRPATLDDGPTLFLWSNDEITRAQSLRRAQITPLEHKNWLAEVFAINSTTSVYIFTGNEMPIGQVKFTSCTAGEYKIGYSIDSAFRGRGLAKPALRKAIQMHSSQNHVSLYIAEVRVGNKASAKSLTSVGFIFDGHLGDGVQRMTLRR
jgi:RimJ/RimL family protein N-acetyltransferase